MKNLMTNTFMMISVSVIMSSCATMFGGSKYYATFEVEGHQNAEVKVSGYGKVAQGEQVKLRRHGAKTVSVNEAGCEKMTKTYANTFNATSVVNLPFNFLIGAGIDAATGAMFKPQTGEEVYKKKNKHFEYVITGYDESCQNQGTSNSVASTEE